MLNSFKKPCVIGYCYFHIVEADFFLRGVRRQYASRAAYYLLLESGQVGGVAAECRRLAFEPFRDKVLARLVSASLSNFNSVICLFLHPFLHTFVACEGGPEV